MPLNCDAGGNSWESSGQQLKPVNLMGNQPWILTGRADAEAEAPVCWSPDVNSQLIGKVPDAEKDWGQKEKRASRDEMVGWHDRCNRPSTWADFEMVRDREDWHATVHGVTKSWTRLGDQTTTILISISTHAINGSDFPGMLHKTVSNQTVY